jgi:myo-inositol 2-dehydrogenase / D-chiro-inositol 1-dehydrogenase
MKTPSPTPSARGVSRRRFLSTSLIAAGSASLSAKLSASAAEAPAAPSGLTRKVRLGVVGTGGRGCWIANLFQRHGGYEMWAVADYFQPVADACGDGLGVDKSRRFSGLHGYRRLIESGVEAIALETPPYFFPEHARAAVEAGLHVYMAKPVAVDVWGCLEIEASASLASRQQRVFLVDYQIPTDPHNLEVVKRVAQGEIGKVISINSHYFAGPFADPPLTKTLESRFRSLIWCNDVALGGGYHVNACIHALDGDLWIAGQRPASAMGFSRIGRSDPHGDSHDVFQLIFEFDNGIILSHRGKHLNNLATFDVVCQAQGQTGFAQICYGGKASSKGPEDGYGGEVQNLYEAGAARNIARFYDCVTQGKSANETVRRSVDGALAAILGREAGLRRGRVSLAELLREKKRLEVDLSGLKT